MDRLRADMPVHGGSGLTGETGWNPAKVAAFSEEHGYYTENAGTSWELMSDGAQKLGLHSEEIPLDESRIRSVLDGGGVVICSVGPGDFTTEGHYILIRGYGKSGFIVNDPNSRSAADWSGLMSVLRDRLKICGLCPHNCTEPFAPSVFAAGAKGGKKGKHHRRHAVGMLQSPTDGSPVREAGKNFSGNRGFLLFPVFLIPPSCDSGRQRDSRQAAGASEESERKRNRTAVPERRGRQAAFL